jgi:hypothetical protein
LSEYSQKKDSFSFFKSFAIKAFCLEKAFRAWKNFHYQEIASVEISMVCRPKVTFLIN